MSLFSDFTQKLRDFFKPQGIEHMHVTFRGWKNETARNGRHDKQGAGSVTYYMQELATGREQPKFPNGLEYVEDETGEVENIGTLPGSLLDITYMPELISPVQIKQYLDQVGLIVE